MFIRRISKGVALTKQYKGHMSARIDTRKHAGHKSISRLTAC